MPFAGEVFLFVSLHSFFPWNHHVSVCWSHRVSVRSSWEALHTDDLYFYVFTHWKSLELKWQLITCYVSFNRWISCIWIFNMQSSSSMHLYTLFWRLAFMGLKQRHNYAKCFSLFPCKMHSLERHHKKVHQNRMIDMPTCHLLYIAEWHSEFSVSVAGFDALVILTLSSEFK